ncbi:MAG TPA: hypothetical protein VNR39_11170 [Pseudolabrys sp.]|nr:hypothetical protein [Pseudolabrys sp.]
MAINGIIETGSHFGTVNTFATFSKTINFSSSTVLATPWLQGFSVNDDDGGVGLNVKSFKTSSGTTTGPFAPGVFASNCTSVTFNMSTNDCIVDAIFRVYFF